MSCVSLPMNAPSSIMVWLLVRAVVVARDRAGADVDVRRRSSRRRGRRGASPSSRRRARSSSSRRSCRPARLRATSRPVRRCANGPTRRVVCDRASSVITQWLRIVTRSPSCESTMRDAAVDFAARADRRAPLERHAGMDDRVGADRHVGVDVRGGRILDRDARRHQFVRFSLSHDSAHRRQLDAAVDAANLVGDSRRSRFRPSGPACR